ncbi:hypothetical protein D9M69_157350 [compost metagenome]
MTPYFALRWTPLFLVIAISAGLVFAPSPDISALASPDREEWVLAEVPVGSIDSSVIGRLAGMQWWGVKATEDEVDSESERISTGADGVARVKVDWLLRGVVRDERGVFALIASDAEAPLKRFAPGATLPGGERLERITEQGIRFSLAEDGKKQGFDRKLYAPSP